MLHTNKKKTDEEYKRELKKIHGDKITCLDSYVDAVTKLKCRCNICGKISIRSPRCALKSHCSTCNHTKSMITPYNEFEEQFKLFSDKLELVSEYKSMSSAIKVKCKDCGKVREITPTELFRRKSHCPCVGCLSCGSRKKITKDEFVKILEKCNPTLKLLKYDKAGSKCTVECLECGYVWSPIATTLNKSGCGCQIQSLGEKHVSILLKNLNIKYIQQKTFDECKCINKLRFDFFLPEYNAIVEIDGIQHKKPVAIFGGKKTFEYIKQLDAIKTEFCRETGIKLIRLSYVREKLYDMLVELTEAINALQTECCS